MLHIDHGILPELLKGEKYTERELLIFLLENKNSKIISKNSIEFNINSMNKHKILEIFEGYEHKSEQPRVYKIPNEKSRVYYTD